MCLSLPFVARALDPGRDIHQYSCQTWTRQNGLPVNGINNIIQTRDGYLWLGTQSGLIRFDGVEFVRLSMPGSAGQRGRAINCMARRAEGGLWFGLDGSAYGSYDGKGNWWFGQWTNNVAGWNVAAMVPLEYDGLLVAGFRFSGWRAHDGSMNPVFPDSTDESPINITAAARDSFGRVWLTSSNGRVYYQEAGEMHECEDPSLAGELITALAVDHEGNVWLGTAHGLVSYDSQFHRRNIPFPGNQITALLVDHHDVLWIGLADDGVGRWDGKAYSTLHKSDGLAGNSVLSLAEDVEGSIWVGTRGGLSQLEDVKFPLITEREGIPGSFKHSVSASPRGGLWVSTDDGIVYYDKWGTLFGKEAGLRNEYVKRVFESTNGTLFSVSGANEVEVLVDGKVVARHPTPGMAVALTEDAEGVVLSSAGELFRVGRDFIRPMSFQDGHQPPMYWILNLMTARDGAIWVSSVNGIFRVKDGQYKQWSTKQGLADQNVHCICEDADGVIWAGLPIGIARLKNGRIRNIREEDGLYDGNVYAIVPDDRGSLWVDSLRGLYRVSLQSLNDVADELTDRVDCVAYDSITAVKQADKYGQEHSGCRTLDGRIWFPSQEGVIMVDPANVPTNRLPPQVQITGVRVNRTDFAPGHLDSLPSGGGELSFSYTALTFISPSKVRFKYRLIGHDPDWVDAGDRRMAFYTNLKPGDYTFRVTACNADGVWNEAGTSIAIVLPAKYYQTAWFKMLTSLFVVVLLIGIYVLGARHYQRRQLALQRTNELLDSKVRARTRELVDQRNLLRTLIDHLPDSIFVKDIEGRVLVDNLAHARLYGASSSEEMVGRTDFDCLPDELARKFQADERAVLQSGEPFDEEESLVHPGSGRTHWLQTTKVPVRGSSGEVIGLAGINRDITDRKEWEASRESLHRQLVDASRRAGMAEVATSVLHNVGNVLNSVNTSAGLILDHVRDSQVSGLTRLVDLLNEHEEDLIEFLKRDNRAAQIAAYLKSLSAHLNEEHGTLLSEAGELNGNIEHIKSIVAMQQSHARVGGVVEPESPITLVEDALRVHANSLKRRGVRVVRHFDPVPVMPMDKHKVLQILVNLVSNARYALDDSAHTDRVLTVGASLNGDNRLRVFVEDNGVGISSENLTRIFSHGFTTRPGGHGFGLHSGALAAREMGGELRVESEGLGHGARFTLELPVTANEKVV